MPDFKLLPGTKLQLLRFSPIDTGIVKADSANAKDSDSTLNSISNNKDDRVSADSVCVGWDQETESLSIVTKIFIPRMQVVEVHFGGFKNPSLPEDTSYNFKQSPSGKRGTIRK